MGVYESNCPICNRVMAYWSLDPVNDDYAYADWLGCQKCGSICGSHRNVFAEHGYYPDVFGTYDVCPACISCVQNDVQNDQKPMLLISDKPYYSEYNVKPVYNPEARWMQLFRSISAPSGCAVRETGYSKLYQYAVAMRRLKSLGYDFKEIYSFWKVYQPNGTQPPDSLLTARDITEGYESISNQQTFFWINGSTIPCNCSDMCVVRLYSQQLR
jgi:hypothetical protein